MITSSVPETSTVFLPRQVREAVADVAVAAAMSSPDALSQAIDRLDLYSPMRVDVR